MGYTFRPRAEWVDPKMPVTGPAQNWAKITHVALHYTAALDLPDGDGDEKYSDVPVYIRSIQRMYLTDPNRGYSIGYNFVVDYTGAIWEARGWDIKCAANKGANEYTVAILFFVDNQDPAGDAMIAPVRALISDMEKRAGKILKIQGHYELDGSQTPTQCPGFGMRAQIHSIPSINGSIFSPRYSPPTTPPPIEVPQPSPVTPYPSYERNKMKPQLLKFKGYYNEILLTESGPIHGTELLVPEWRVSFGVEYPANHPAATKAADGKWYGAREIDAHPQAMKSWVKQMGLEMADYAKAA